jgi:hypothetical protein
MTLNLVNEIINKPLGNGKSAILFHQLIKLMDISTITKQFIDKEDLYSYINNEFEFTAKLEPPTPEETNHNDNKENYCLCTTKIIHHYQIINTKTNKKCWIGSECINNFLPASKKTLKNSIAKEKYGSLYCLNCGIELTNRKLKCQQQNLCNKFCLEKYNLNQYKNTKEKTKEKTEYITNDKIIKTCNLLINNIKDPMVIKCINIAVLARKTNEFPKQLNISDDCKYNASVEKAKLIYNRLLIK